MMQEAVKARPLLNCESCTMKEVGGIGFAAWYGTPRDGAWTLCCEFFMPQTYFSPLRQKRGAGS